MIKISCGPDFETEPIGRIDSKVFDMKNKLLFVVLCFLINATDVAAQANLNISGDSRPIGMEEKSIFFTVRNNGTENSQPFKIKVWVSIDGTINDLDLNSISSELPSLRPYAPLNQVFDSRTQTVQFSFPLPMEASTLPRLVGDTLSPADWLGREIFVKGCIAADLINFDECSEFSRLVAPPRPNFTVSSGISRDFIEIKWPPIKPDGVRPMVDSYVISEDPYNDNRSSITVTPASIPIIVDTDQVERHRFEVNDADPGRRYLYDIQSCHDSSGPAPVCAPIRRRPIGNSLADYSATVQTEPRGIRVDWEPFWARAPGYELERCLEGQTEGCTRIRRKGFDTTYLDLDVERAKNYVYTVFACESYRSTTDPGRCTSVLYRQGVTNLGRPGLVDEYEDDDNPAQAKQVRSTVSQLRSFDTNDDQDWVEIILSKPQAITIVTSGDTNNDTELILYQADASTVIEGDSGGQVGLYARLKTDVLAAGRYYLKVFQKDPGLDALYKPVANYRLDIEITEQQVILTPIINLLLGDD